MQRAVTAKHRLARLATTLQIRRSSTKPHYVSTPIFYVNAVPHVGHLYTSVIADVISRYAKLRSGGGPTYLNTGTDEHGLKIQQAAQAAGVEPKAFCDRISTRFKDLASAANMKYDRFIRTTDADHIRAAQHFWTELQKSGHIYKGEHSGWYSISDECFYTESQIRPAEAAMTQSLSNQSAPKMVAIESGSAVEWTKEENYKFRLGNFREPLLSWIQGNPKSVWPPSRRSELLEYLSDPASMPDLSISRPRKRLQWGIPVPGDDEHTIYVWLEALVNYLTSAGYPWSNAVIADGKGWPSDVQVVGKDIVRFHAVLFPCFLMAVGLPLPKTVLAHGHWTMDHMKMSKSRGNVADPFAAMELFGVDTVRYFLMRVGGNFRNDADWSEEQLKTVYNHDLRNVLGNLLARVLSPRLIESITDSQKAISRLPENERQGLSYAELVADQDSLYSAEDRAIKHTLQSAQEDVQRLMDDFEYGKALERLYQCVVTANEHTTQLAWWKHTLKSYSLPRELPASLSASDIDNVRRSIIAIRRTHVYTHETLRIVGTLLQPFIPMKAGELLDALGVSGEHRGWEAAYLRESGVDTQLVNETAQYRAGWTGLFPKLSEKLSEEEVSASPAAKHK